MARPRKSDPSVLLDKAMHLFWKQGYEATSVQDLGRELDIHPGTLYDTFGDKHALYLAALDRYAQTAGCYLPDLLTQGGSPKAAIEAIFQQSMAILLTPSGRYGCMMTNAALERAEVDPEAARKIADYQQLMEEALASALHIAQAKGEIRSRTPAEVSALARFLNGCLQGMRVMAHTGPDTQPRLEAMVQGALSLLN